MVLEEIVGNRWVYVASLVESGCAERSGVLPGDVLLSVHGESCAGTYSDTSISSLHIMPSPCSDSIKQELAWTRFRLFSFTDRFASLL